MSNSFLINSLARTSVHRSVGNPAANAPRSSLTSFEIELLRTTPVQRLEDAGVINLTEIDGERYRERTMLDFNSAAILARMPGPKFVFIHIISPHEPFVFGADGKPIDPAPFMDQNQLYTQEQYMRGYQQQVPFADMTRLQKALSSIFVRRKWEKVDKKDFE